MGSDAGNWCLIESDPGLFTELIRGFGVSGVQVEELYSLDDDFSRMKPIHGLIFLFKWRPEEETEGEIAINAQNVYFAQQVIQNACASQAIINLLLNTNHPDVQLGKTLEEFRSFTSAFDPANRGLCLSNSEEIRNVHNSYARPTYLELDQPKKWSKEENFHFITYVPVDGKIYELDGLREAPVIVGSAKESEDWLEAVKPHIKKRIQRYQTGEIHFNLMGVVPDLKANYQKKLDELVSKGMDSDSVNEEIGHLQALITDEEEKMQQYKLENNRRRHNYIPFIVELLKILAKEGKLVPLVREAKQKLEEQHKRDEQSKKE